MHIGCIVRRWCPFEQFVAGQAFQPQGEHELEHEHKHADESSHFVESSEDVAEIILKSTTAPGTILQMCRPVGWL